MKEALLPANARRNFLLSCPFIAWSRGGRKSSQGDATLSPVRKRELGAPLGHLLLCRVILVYLERNSPPVSRLEWR